MRASRKSSIGQVRQAAASLGPLDYVATVALVAIYVIGTSVLRELLPSAADDHVRT
jgi:hypothetical protein